MPGPFGHRQLLVTVPAARIVLVQAQASDAFPERGSGEPDDEDEEKLCEVADANRPVPEVQCTW